ncbi:MAG: hypothetical protein AW06_002441 [Candidatus Accumulibacter cognatus]|uniref:Uncharacterized protein n=3 Tax=Candidatus Accumulibacter TaxID=327159 RepID=A0A080MGR6_9PROT|nr:MAG: hypothetical protein AW06_002441 [Candidatus Accumulibacter cognatus]
MIIVVASTDPNLILQPGWPVTAETAGKPCRGQGRVSAGDPAVHALPAGHSPPGSSDCGYNAASSPVYHPVLYTNLYATFLPPENAMSDPAPRPLRSLLITGSLLLALSGCDAVQQKLGLEAPAAKLARDEAEGKAVGGACRQSGRAIEDCYSIYSWLPKAAVYEGWRDMDIYMRENKLETVEPQLPPPQPPGTKTKKPAEKKPAAPVAEETAADTKGNQKEGSSH